MKKFLSYVLTFLVLFGITAAATVSLSSGGGSGSIYPMGGEQSSASSVFSSLLAAFQDNQQFNVNGKLAIDFNGTNVDVDVFLNADISESSNMKFEGAVKIGANTGAKALEFSFIDNSAYLFYSNNSLKISGSSITDIVDFVKEFVKNDAEVQAPSEDAGEAESQEVFDVDSLLQKLMASLENVVETELPGGGKEIALNVEGLADLKVTIDENERPSKAVIKTEDIGGIKLSAEVSVGFNNYIIVSNPEQVHPERDYVEVGEVLKLVKNTMATKGLTLDVNALYDNKSFDANLALDLESKNLSVALLNKYYVSYLDGDIFVDANGAKLKVAKSLVESFPKIKDKISALLGEKDIDLDGIKQFTNKFSQLELVRVLAAIKDISSSSNGITVILDGQPLDINGQLRAFVGIENGRLSSIVVGGEIEGKRIELNVGIQTEAKFEEIDKEQFLDIENLVNINKDYFSTKELSLGFELLLKGKEELAFSGKLDANINSNYYSLCANTSYQRGYSANLVYKNGTIFAKLNNIMLKVPDGIIKELLEKYKTENNIASRSIETLVKDYLSEFSVDDLANFVVSIQRLEVSSDGLEFELDGSALGFEGSARLTLALADGRVDSLDLIISSSNGEEARLVANVLSNSVQEETFSEGRYLDAIALYNNIKAIDLKKGRVNLSAKVNYDGKAYNIGANFAGSTKNEKAMLSVRLGGDYNLELEVHYFGGDAFIRVGNAYIKVPKQLAKSLVGKIEYPSKEQISADIKDSDIYGKITEFISGFDISMLESLKDVHVDSSVVQMTIGKELFGLEKDVIVFIRLSGEQICGLEVVNFATQDLEASINASLSFDEPTLSAIDESKYLDISKFYDGIENLLNSKNTGVNGYVDLSIKDKFSGRLTIDLGKKLTMAGLTGSMNLGVVSGEDNLSLQTNFFDDTLFASFQGLKVQISAANIMPTVKNICNAFDIDYAKCSKIVTAIEALLGGKGIISALSGFTYNAKLPDLENANINLDLATIVDLLNGITINAQTINVTLNGELFGLEGTISAILELDSNNMLTRVFVDGLNYKEFGIGCDLSIDYSEQTIPTFGVEEREEYIDLYGLSEAIGPVYNTIKGGSISGTFTLSFDYKGANTLNVSYGIKLEKSGLSGFIQTEFKGLNINIYYIDGTIYFDIVGLKVYLHTTDFDEFKDRLGIKDDGKTNETIDNFKALLSAKTISEFISALSKIDLGFVKKAVFTPGNINATFAGGVSIGVSYGEKVEHLSFSAKNVLVELECTSFNEVTIDALDTSKFEPYTILFDTYDNIKKTLNQKQFAAHASAASYVDGAVKDNASVNLNLDIANGINANGDITVSGNTNLYLTFGYQEDTLFAKYGEMRLKIHRSGLASLLAIALDLVGIDPGKVLGSDYSDVNLNSDAIKDIIPDFDMGNPLDMLHLIKSINIEDGAFVIVLNGSRINTKSGKDMTLKFKTDETGVTEVDLLNIYTASDSNEYFNFVLTFGEFTGVEGIANPNDYIDITSSPDLIQGLINTYDLQEWNIKGTVALTLKGQEILGQNLLVGIDAQVKIDDEGKPRIAIEITNLPLFSLDIWFKGTYGTNANTNYTSMSRGRSISIYYDDGYCYLKTVDPECMGGLFNTQHYDELVRETKVPYTEVFNNLEHYLQWAFGFTDDLMNEIHSSIEVAKSQPIGTDLLSDYSFDGKTHNIVVNMEAITHDSKVGSLSVSFETIDKSQDGERAKHYVSKLGVDLSLLNFINIQTRESDPLNVQFDTPTDFSAMEKYIKEFNSTKTPYKDYWIEGGNKSLKNDTKYNVSLNKDNGEDELVLTGTIGDLVTTNSYEDSREKVSLPTLETKLVDDGNSIKYYEFDGWFYENGEKFVEDYLTGNMRLVAHWKFDSERFYYNITIQDDVTGEKRIMRVLEGDNVPLETLAKDSHDDLEGGRKVHKDYAFVGWLDGEGTCYNSQLTMPSFDLVLTASWNIKATKYFIVNFDSGIKGEKVDSIEALDGTTITFASLAEFDVSSSENETISEFTKYTFGGWYLGGDKFESITLTEDFDGATFVAEWVVSETYTKKRLTIYEFDESGNAYVAQESMQIVNRAIEFNSSIDGARVFTSFENGALANQIEDLTMRLSLDNLYVVRQRSVSVSGSLVQTENGNAVLDTFEYTENLYYGDAIDLKRIATLAQGKNQDKDYAKQGKYFFRFTELSLNGQRVAWLENGNIVIDESKAIMGLGNIELNAVYDPGYKKYFKVEFVVDWDRTHPSDDNTTNPLIPRNPKTPETLYVLEGDSITLTVGDITIDRKEGLFSRPKFKVVSWKDETTQTIISSIENISRDYVMLAVWQRM